MVLATNFYKFSTPYIIVITSNDRDIITVLRSFNSLVCREAQFQNKHGTSPKTTWRGRGQVYHTLPAHIVWCQGTSLVLEWAVEQTHSALPELTNVTLWVGGQRLGAVFLITVNALEDRNDNDKMWRSLIFETVVACAVARLIQY